MKVIFVRYSEPDYSMLDQHHRPQDYRGFGRDLAPLTDRGRSLAVQVARNLMLKEADVIISSSITRALETATYIVRETNLPLLVEPFFHEWRPDINGLNYTEETLSIAYEAFHAHHGRLAQDCPIRYETADEVRERFIAALEKYRNYETVVIVCHGMLMRQSCPQEKIDYCQIIEVEL